MQNAVTKPYVFISHIAEDASLALYLKNAINRDFLGLVHVFASSDIESIDAGAKWLDSVKEALEKTTLVLVLTSPTSVRRPWINFEAGAAWILTKTIVPVCFGGLTPSDLLMPFAVMNGVDATEPEGVERLYRRIAKDLSACVPPHDFAATASFIARSAGPEQVWARYDRRPPDLLRLAGLWHGEAEDIDVPGILSYDQKLSYTLKLELKRRDRSLMGTMLVYCRERGFESETAVRVVDIVAEHLSFEYSMTRVDALHFGVTMLQVLGVGTEMSGFYLSKKIYEGRIGFGRIHFERVPAAT